MRALAVPTEILLTFQKNRSKHLRKSLSLAKKADHFTEKEDQIGCKFTRAPDSLGRLYYLLRALYHSHRFRTVEIGIDGHVLIEREIHELWNTLSCFIESRRFKNTRNHCDCVLRESSSLSIYVQAEGEEVEEVSIVPCRRAFFGRPSGRARDKESFLDVAKSLYCDICPLFREDLFRKALRDEWGQITEIKGLPEMRKKLNK